MSITLHLQIIFALSGNMQFGRTTLTANKHHTNTAYGGYLALVADFYFIKTSVDASGSFQFDLALVGNGQFSLSVTLGAVDGSTILSTDASGGVVKCDVGAAFGSNGDTHAIAADIHLGIFEGDVPGIVLIVDATNLAVDVQRAVLYGQAGTVSAIDCRTICSLNFQGTVICHSDTSGAVDAMPVVIVSQAALIVIDFVNTSVHRVDGQLELSSMARSPRCTIPRPPCVVEPASVLLMSTSARQSHIRTARDHHSGRSMINVQRALVAGLVSFDGKELSALYHPPLPPKNQEVWAMFVDTHKFMGFFRMF